MTRSFAQILVGMWAGALCAAELPPDEHFRARVWPLLERACVKCHGAEKQKADFIEILDTYKKMNYNAVIVQIRSSGEAFYPTELAPWSRYLTVAWTR